MPLYVHTEEREREREREIQRERERCSEEVRKEMLICGHETTKMSASSTEKYCQNYDKDGHMPVCSRVHVRCTNKY